MRISHLINKAMEAGVYLFVEEKKLKFQLSVEEFPVDLKEEILANKTEIIEFLGKNVPLSSTKASPKVKKYQRLNNTLPMSFQQQRMWFIDELQGGDSSNYNMCFAFKVIGSFNIDDAEKALSKLIERHEILRTTYHSNEEGPVQVIGTDFDFKVSQVDSNSEEKSTSVDELIETFCIKPFDLSKDLTLKCMWIKTQINEGVLVFNLHHIASDGWSEGIIVNEFKQLYKAFNLNSKITLPPLKLQYSDYAMWQREYLQGEHLNSQLKYWTNHLADAPAVHSLPLDFERPEEAEFAGGFVTSSLPSATAKKLSYVAIRYQVTPFMVMHAVLSLMLSRSSNSSKIVIGTPVANRMQKELESTIGFFTNTLALHSDTENQSTFLDYLAHIRQVNLDAQDNQELPFEQLVEHLKIPRSLQHGPIFQVMLSMDTNEGGDLDLDGVEFLPMETGTERSLSELRLDVEIAEDGMGLSWNFNRALFKKESIEKYNRYFINLLNSVLQEPKEELRDLKMMPERETRFLLDTLNDTNTAYENDLLINQRFEEQVERFPNKNALTFKGNSLTYFELNARANQLAYLLKEKGVTAGTLVGVSMQRCLEMPVAILGILKAGAAYVPLDPNYPKSRLDFMIADSEIKYIVKHSDCLIELDLSDEIQKFDLDSVKVQKAIDSQPNANHILDETQSTSSLAYVIYTSGSTGQPKGVVQTHENVTRLFLTTEGLFHFDEGDVWTLFHSIAFDFSVWELWGALLYGGHLIIPSYNCTRDPEQFIKLCQTQGVTVLNQTPSAFQSLSRVAIKNSISLDSLRYVVFGGEALQLESLASWWSHYDDSRPQLINMYGITETTVHVTFKALKQQQKSGSLIGHRLPDQKTYLLDANKNPVPYGVVGEIYVGGAGLALGYLNRAELTKQRFIDSPFNDSEKLYRTGDLARYVDNGELEFVGRDDEQVKIRGFRIELGEIEQQLLAYDLVSACVVLDKEDEQGQKYLVAYIESNKASKANESSLIEQIRNWLGNQIPEYMVPASFVIIDMWPKSPSGKVNKKALLDLKSSVQLYEYVAPTSETERLLCDVWVQVLDVSKVGTQDNFFSIGGDSIRALSVIAKARNMGLDFSVKDLFVNPTIHALGAEIDEKNTTVINHQDLVPFELLTETEKQLFDMLEVEDAYPLTALQQGMIFHNLMDNEAGFYHDLFSFSVNCQWDQEKFKSALTQLVEKHSSFRTVYLMEQSRPIQVVYKKLPLPFECKDLRGQDNAKQRELIESWAKIEKSKAFDFSKPLCNVIVHILDDEEFYFSLSFHHAVWDGWSVASLEAELFALYRCLLDGDELEKTPLPLPYSYFVAEEIKALESPQARLFWQEKLNDIKLPWWSSTQRETAHTVTFDLSLQQSQSVLSLAKSLKVQEKSVFLAVHMLLIRLLTGDEDTTSSVVVHGRPEAEHSDKTLGLFLNSLPFRLRKFDCSWKELIDSVEKELLQIIEYRCFPLAEVQKLVQLDFSASLFNYIDFHVLDKVADDIDVMVEDDFEQTNYQLDADYIKDTASGQCSITLKLDSLAFCETLRNNIKRYLNNIINSLVSSLDNKINVQSLLGQSEIDQILCEFNSPRVDYLGGNIQQRFERQASKTPNDIAVVHGVRRLTYQEVNYQANRLAHYLIENGVSSNKLVGIYAQRSPEFLVAIIAIMKAGGAYVPLDPINPVKRIEYMVSDSQISLLLSETNLLNELSLSDEVTCFCLSNLRSGLNKYSNNNPTNTTNSSDLAYMIYTSGSTGTPKGALVHHAGALNHIDAEFDVMGFMDESKNLLPFNFLQSAASSSDVSVWQFLAPVISGGKTVILDNMTDMPTLVTTLQNQQVHLIETAPVVLQLLVDYLMTLDSSSRQLKDLCWLMTIAEPTPIGLINQWISLYPHVPIMNGYGPSEASDDITQYIIRKPLPESVKSLPIGKPLPNLTMYVLNSQMQIQPIGAPGELGISGVGVGPGYWNNPQKTEDRFVHNQFYQSDGIGVHGDVIYLTGDLGRWLPDGNLEFMGRIDNQIKVRGFRIELGEIEAVLSTIDGIKEVAVIVYQNHRKQNSIAAFVVGRDNTQLSHAELRSELQSLIPDHMIPSVFIWLDKMPLNAADKIDRLALAKLDVSEQAESDYEPPTNRQEKTLCEVWSDVLGVDNVSITDNFFALGGDSILAVQVVSKSNQLDIFVTVRQLYEYQDIKSLAKQAHAKNVVQAPQNTIIGEQKLLPIQREFLRNDKIDQDHYNMSVMLRAPFSISLEKINAIVEALYQRHDVLRLTCNDENGMSIYQDLNARLIKSSVAEIIINASSQGEADQLFEEQCNLAQSQLSLSSGPLLKVVLLESNQEKHLLITLHHLIVDGISWRVILQDIELAYQQIRQNLPIKLSPKSSSFQQWGEFLVDYANSELFKEEQDYWLNQLSSPVASLPLDNPDFNDNSWATTQRKDIEFSQATTQDLLNSCHHAYGTQINDLLIAALYMSVSQWAQQSVVKVFLEGHGREALTDNLEFGETVGWFTSTYPLFLTADSNTQVSGIIKSIKEIINSVPNNGIGYGLLTELTENSSRFQQQKDKSTRSSIIFNYLGQFDQTLSEDTEFGASEKPCGNEISQNRERECILGFTGSIIGGELSFSLDYNQHYFNGETIELISSRFKNALVSIVEHCKKVTVRQYTPSDFPLASVSQEQLSKWQVQHSKLEDIYHATSMQQGMLFHSQLDSSAYVCQADVTISGYLDTQSFIAAWETVVNRNSALRTAFAGYPAQQLVLSEVEFPWREFDLHQLSANEQAQAFDEFKDTDKQSGFAPHEAPLMRIAIFNLGNNEFRLLWSYHHVLLDGWSAPLILEEMAFCYDNLSNGVQPKLPPAPKYKEYISWLNKQDKNQAVDFWRNYLAEVSNPSILNQSAESIAESEQVFEAVTINLNSKFTEQVKSLVQQSQTTLNTVFQAAWAYLLHIYTGEKTVVLGETVSGRPADLEGVESTVGLFINTLPVSVTIDSELTIVDWLRQMLRQSVKRSDYSYLSLNDIQKLVPLGNRGALFDSLIVIESFPEKANQKSFASNINQSSLNITSNIRDENTNYPLTVVVIPGDEVQLEFSFNTSCFKRAEIDAIISHYKNILNSMLIHTSKSISDLEIISFEERNKLLQIGSGSKESYPKDETICQLFEQQVDKYQNKVAIEYLNNSVTYSELNFEANRLSTYLAKKQVLPGDNVIICLERSIELVVSIIATLKSGAIYVPLDPNYPAERVKQIIGNAEPKLIITDSVYEEMFIGAEDKSYITLNMQSEKKLIESCDDSNPLLTRDCKQAAYINYTSGSTGIPKGVLVPHIGVVRLVRNNNFMDLNESTKFLFASSISFDAATLEFWGPLLNGGTLVVYPEKVMDLTKLNRVISKYEVNSIWLTAGLFEQWSEVSNKADSLNWILSGGDVVSPNAVRRVQQLLPNANVVNGYGPTENTTFTCCYTIPKNFDKNNIPIGKVVDGSSIYVLSQEMSFVPKGQVGELYVSGDGLALGYHNQVELTKEKFILNPFCAENESLMYRTGDLVRYLDNDCLEFIGRADNQVKIRGFRIETEEVERSILKLTNISSCVVIPKGEGSRKRLIAYLVVDSNRVSNKSIESEVALHLKSTLPGYMLPAAYKVIDKIPLSQNGKVDRRALPLVENEKDSQGLFVAPESKLQSQLCEIWSELLGVEKVGVNDKFFEIGGDSISVLGMQKLIKQKLKIDIGVVDIFGCPTIKDLARNLDDTQKISSVEKIEQQPKVNSQDNKIAIIGMACRFPDASTPEQFWQNITDKVESIQHFSDEELLLAGVHPELIRNQNYVKSGVLLKGLELFDADYFGFTPREAELIDPQQRLLFECVDEALIVSGNGVREDRNNIGVFVGVGDSRYLFDNLLPQMELLDLYDELALMISNGKDFVSSRLSHKLNLRGPSINVNTACSTSLVAIHQACRSLIEGSSNIAVAGGASIHQLKAAGMSAQDDDIASTDGHCRPFDQKSTGTRAGSGAAVVVLKRLQDAIDDGDDIQGVILGTAINNDGADKVGYTAPSVSGQTNVIKRALEIADVTAESISYVETHGTATNLGDPVEISALSQAYSDGYNKSGCALGAVKANIGHLDTAAGVAGLIKTTLALKHRQLPPNINFDKPNPLINFDDNGFYVNTELKTWGEHSETLRAGVSSFGIGGTNAHVILESFEQQEISPNNESLQLINISAKSKYSLMEYQRELLDYLENQSSVCLTDIAYTLQTKRVNHQYRSSFACYSVNELKYKLRNELKIVKTAQSGKKRNLIFMFSGQGSQYLDMAKDLYIQDSVFRSTFDNCATLISNKSEFDIRAIFDSSINEGLTQNEINKTNITQPLLFTIEYSLYMTWQNLGVTPDYMIGHSLGEYVAACIAGVFSLEDALHIVTVRGQLMQATAPGEMLSIVSSLDNVEPLLARVNCCLAAINAERSIVVSGEAHQIKILKKLLTENEIEFSPLETLRAYHSKLMEPVLGEFRELLESISLNVPKKRIISNVTGNLLTELQAQDVEYWVEHLRNTVMFKQGLETLQKVEGANIFLEIGPGKSLCSLVKQNESVEPGFVLSSTRHKKDSKNDVEYFYEALSKLWSFGVTVNWESFYREKSTRHICLPGYQFDRQKYWIPERSSSTNHIDADELQQKSLELQDWFYEPVWSASQYTPRTRKKFLKENEIKFSETASCVVLMQNDTASENLFEIINSEYPNLTFVKVCPGAQYQKASDSEFYIDLSNADDYRKVFDELESNQNSVELVLHCLNVELADKFNLDCEVTFDKSLFSLSFLCQALESSLISSKTRVKVLVTGANSIDLNDQLNPVKSSLNAVPRIITSEFENITCQLVEVSLLEEHLSINDQKLLVEEISADSEEEVISIRNGYRWTRHFHQIEIDQQDDLSLLRQQGVYGISGGLGGIGYSIASLLSKKFSARLLIIGRSELPSKEAWNDWLNANDETNVISQNIRKLQQLELFGGEVFYLSADVSRVEDVTKVKQLCIEKFNGMDGFIHSAGVPGGGMLSIRSVSEMQEVLRPKVQGTVNLINALREFKLDFFVSCSSLASVIPEIAQYDYSAANAFQDSIALAMQDSETQYISINWDSWKESGMAFNAQLPEWLQSNQSNSNEGISDEEGRLIFERIMCNPAPQVIVSQSNVDYMIELSRQAPQEDILEETEETSFYSRPNLETLYVEADTETERELTQIQQKLLGIASIGIDDDFFELGGDSLLLVKLVSEINTRWNIKITLRILFENSSVREMAKIVEDLVELSVSAVTSITESEEDDVVEEGMI